ncbi:MAG: hypothetical protein DRQ10_04185 [Candidatus Hydrothermota bacterium]|nr:MAG: hypothetical protein DRQ10_04185 [Candidatus Hydrothermae bacterium]
MIILLLAVVLQAGEIVSSGHVEFFYEEDRRAGFRIVDSMLPPPQSGMISLGLKLNLMGYPVLADFGFSSENRYTGTLINRYSVRFEPKTFAAKRVGVLRVLEFVRLGDFFPNETELALSKIKIRGIGIGLGGKTTSIRLYYGQVKRKFMGGKYAKPSYQRLLTGAFLKTSPLKTLSLNIHILKGWDVMSEDILSDSVHPFANAVIGGGLRFNYKKLFTLETEAELSASTDLNGSDVKRQVYALKAFNLIMPVNLSTTLDWAALIRLKVQPMRKTRFNLCYKYAGPGYNSFGAQRIRSNWKELTFKGEYRGWGASSNWIRLELSHGRDNLLNQSVLTTRKSRIKISSHLMLKMNMFAAVSGEFQRIDRRSEDSEAQRDNLSTITFALFQNTQLSDKKLSTTFSFTATSLNGAQDRQVQSANFGSSLKTKSSLVSVGLSFSKSVSSLDTVEAERILVLNLSATKTFLDRRLTATPSVSTHLEKGVIRTGVSFSVSFQPFEQFHIGLMAVRDNLRNDVKDSGWLIRITGHSNF